MQNKRNIIIFSIIGVVIIFVLVFFVVKYNKNKSLVGVLPIDEEIREEIEKEKPTVFPIGYDTDKDRDGIDDETEKDLGLSSKTFDTDEDGISDFAEINSWKTDPLKSDTDGDGMLDGEEVLRGRNPLIAE